MADESLRIKYLGVSLSYPAYKKLQIALFIGWILLGLVLIPFAGHEMWLLGNSWWLCPLVAVGEAVEAFIAISAAKKKHASQD